MTEWDEEIHARGRVYTLSQHLRDNRHRHPEATKENIERVLINPARQEPVGDRRYLYWGYLPYMEQFMKIIEDRLPNGEYQILSAYCPVRQPTLEGIHGGGTA